MSDTTQVLPSHLYIGVGGTLAVVVIALVVAAVVVRMLTRHAVGLAQGFVLLVIVGVTIGLAVRWFIPQGITNTVASIIGVLALWPYGIAERWDSSTTLSFMWGCAELALCTGIYCSALWYGSLALTRNGYAAAIALMLGAAFCTVGFILGFAMA